MTTPPGADTERLLQSSIAAANGTVTTGSQAAAQGEGDGRKRAQRQDLLDTLDLVLFASFLQLFYIDHSLVLLIVRCISQIQYSSPALIHPGRSLSFFAAFLAILNLSFTLNHLIVPLPLPRQGGIVLDFIGQDYRPSKLTILLMDIFIAVAQLIFLLMSYDESHRGQTEPSTTAEGTTASHDASLFDSEDGYEEVDSKDSNPYSRPVVNIRFRPTLRRFLHARPPSSASTSAISPSLAASTDENARLTSRGRYNRAERARRGLETSRLDDSADEERSVGIT